jgi:signal transduction histidine kinase
MSEYLDNLIKTNDFLKNLLDNMPTAVFIVDENVRVKNVNNSFSQLFQKSGEEVYNELCGNALGCVFPVKEKTDCGETVNCNECELRKNLIRCLKYREGNLTAVITREFFIADEFIEKHFYVTTNYLEFNAVDYALVLIQDITELEAQRKHLEELNYFKNEFLGIAAHDLRNPITVIKSLSHLLLKHSDRYNAEEKAKLLNMIRNSSNFMYELVINLLDISKIESGNLHLELSKMNYEDFIEECLIYNRLLSKEKDIEIEFEFDENIPNLEFDKTKIRQVLNNLLSNAVKFSPKKSNILVKIEQESNEIITKVIDKGPGIPKDELSKLFKAFQTTSLKPINGEKGTGLGLAISKKIIESHKGKIGVLSEVGKGSTFYFSLPKITSN